MRASPTSTPRSVRSVTRAIGRSRSWPRVRGGRCPSDPTHPDGHDDGRRRPVDVSHPRAHTRLDTRLRGRSDPPCAGPSRRAPTPRDWRQRGGRAARPPPTLVRNRSPRPVTRLTIPIVPGGSHAIQSNEVYPHGRAPGHVRASSAVRIKPSSLDRKNTYCTNCSFEVSVHARAFSRCDPLGIRRAHTTWVLPASVVSLRNTRLVVVPLSLTGRIGRKRSPVAACSWFAAGGRAIGRRQHRSGAAPARVDGGRRASTRPDVARSRHARRRSGSVLMQRVVAGCSSDQQNSEGTSVVSPARCDKASLHRAV